jgi:hypothetical protein
VHADEIRELLDLTSAIAAYYVDAVGAPAHAPAR